MQRSTSSRPQRAALGARLLPLTREPLSSPARPASVLPIHASSDYLELSTRNTTEVTSNLMRLTMSNMYPYSTSDERLADDRKANILWCVRLRARDKGRGAGTWP